MSGRARAAALLLSPLLAIWAVAIAAGGARAAGGTERLFRASASATAVHGFYDHRDLFPVPIGNLDVPESQVSLEPGPAVSALGSFLWDPQGAELSTILCELSNGQMCFLPDYPFQARATYPSSGKPQQPPSLRIADPRSPVAVSGADESATATAHAGSAGANVAGFDAIPMTGNQARAARALALAAAVARASIGGGGPALPAGLPTVAVTAPLASPPAGSDGNTTPWLVAIGAAASASSLSSVTDAATATASSSVHELALLGGTITIHGASGEASASEGASAGARADARWTGISVGGFAATVGPDGLQVQDRRLGGEQLAALQDAVNRATARAGLRLSRGAHTITRAAGSVTAEAWALTIDYAHQNVPSNAPRGAGGQDVLQIPVGYAAASAQLARFAGPPPFPVPPPLPPPPAGPAGGAPLPAPPGPGSAGGLPPNGGLGPPPAQGGGGGAGAAPVLRPVHGVLAHGIPAASFVLLALAGVAFVIGMTGLKTMESLREGIAR